MNLPLLEVKSISIGFGGIDLAGNEKINELQLGYSVHPDGHSLAGSDEGDWKKDWIVIGCETLCGEPIFIDASDPGFPVYTAMHGQGSWDPDLISSTHAGFRRIMGEFEKLAAGRENPVLMEQNPLTQKDVERFTAFVLQAGELEEAYFWMDLVVQDT